MPQNYNDYWFAMRAIDENENPSDDSNSPKTGKINSAIDSTLIPINPPAVKQDATILAPAQNTVSATGL